MTEITEADIHWGLPPSARFERFPERLLDALTHDELRAFVSELQDDLAAYRVMSQEAVGALATVTRERDRLRAALRSRR